MEPTLRHRVLEDFEVLHLDLQEGIRQGRFRHFAKKAETKEGNTQEGSGQRQQRQTQGLQPSTQHGPRRRQPGPRQAPLRSYYRVKEQKA